MAIIDADGRFDQTHAPSPKINGINFYLSIKYQNEDFPQFSYGN